MVHRLLSLVLILLSLLVSSQQAQAQLIQGLVVDESGNPVPYVGVRLLDASQGTLTNEAGEFSIRSQGGRVSLVFSHMAFERDTVRISLPHQGRFVHTLRESPYSIDIVQIEGGKKDPAYAIMKELISRKSDQKGGPDAYTCSSYMKALLIHDDSTLWEPPKEREFLGMKFGGNTSSDESGSQISLTVSKDTSRSDTTARDTVPPGPPEPRIATFMEMYRTTHYQAPGQVKTIVEGYRDYQNRSPESGGIQVSFDDPNASEDYRTELQNPYLFLPKYPGADLNLYKNLIHIPELGDRPFVSPLNSTLWQIIYDFRLVDRAYVNGKVIFEIELQPKNPIGPYFAGTIWVVDRDWVISRADLSIQDAGLNLFSHFHFVHESRKDPAGEWLLAEETYEYHIKEGKRLNQGTTYVEHKDYDLHPVFSRNFFRNEVLRTDAEAFGKDSSFWATMRPYELNSLEETFIVRQDSIKKVQASDEYIRIQDSIYNHLGWRDVLFEGMTYLDRGHGMRYSLDPIASMPRPFGVGGYRHAISGSVAKTWSRAKQLRVRLETDYGFNNRDLKGGGQVGFVYDPRHFGRAFVRGGDVYSTITTFTNIGAILSRSNFVNKKYIGFGHSRELLNGLSLSVRADFAHFEAIDQLQLAQWGNELFGDLNIPQTFDPFRQLMIEVTLQFTPFQKYYLEPYRKVNLPTNWPTFTLSYEQAIPGVFGSSINWSKLTLIAEQEIPVGSMGHSRWRARAGTFPVEGNLRFTDYTFFRGSDPYFFANPLRAFQLLGPTLSTPNEYIEAHYIHDFGGALVQKIPLLKHVPIHLAGGGGSLYIRDQNFLHSEVFAGFGVPIRIKSTRFKIAAYYVTAYSNYEKALSGQVKFGISFYDNYRKRWTY